MIAVDAALKATVLDAFWSAHDAGAAPCECYRAGVRAWKDGHQDHAPSYAATSAVAIMLESRMARMRVSDGPSLPSCLDRSS